MSVTRPANPSDKHIIRFCAAIVPHVRPMRMPIRPTPGSTERGCFNNVQRQVECHGGRIQFGWAIWEWPRVYVEAEHHAVYVPPDGAAWIDITPAEDDDVTRVFLPDDSATFTINDKSTQRESHRMALAKDSLIDTLFMLAMKQNKIWRETPDADLMGVSEQAEVQLFDIFQAKAIITHEIGMKYLHRNDRCFCGSGDKFKRCHGRA